VTEYRPIPGIRLPRICAAVQGGGPERSWGSAQCEHRYYAVLLIEALPNHDHSCFCKVARTTKQCMTSDLRQSRLERVDLQECSGAYQCSCVCVTAGARLALGV